MSQPGGAVGQARFGPLTPQPAYRQICAAIEAEIMGGRLKPGDMLPTETELAQAFAINRSTVREGIRLLEESGLVERSGGRRLTVAKPSAETLGVRMSQALILHRVTMQDLWQVMLALEPTAAALAATARTEADLAALEANLAASEAAKADARRLTELDLDFHALVAEAAHNRALTLAREAIGRLFFPAFASVVMEVDTAAERLLTAHREIAKAIVAQDQAEAMRWMERHVIDFRRGYLLAGLDPDAPVVSLQQRQPTGLGS